MAIQTEWQDNSLHGYGVIVFVQIDITQHINHYS